jgi:hypothetical protein
MFPNRLRKGYEHLVGIPPHMEQHFYICDATAPALVQLPKLPEEPVTVDSIRKSRLLWTWLRREAALDQATEMKILRERDERLAKQGRLQEYQHVEMQPLCRLRAHLPPAVNRFKGAGGGSGWVPSSPRQQPNAAAEATAAARGGVSLVEVAKKSPRTVGSARPLRPAAFLAAPPNPVTKSFHKSDASAAVARSPRNPRPMSSNVKHRIMEIAERLGA